MRRLRILVVLGGLVVLAAAGTVRAEPLPDYVRQEDVIYGRKAGLALTMDVFTPKKNANGLGVVFVVSGGWFSRPANIRPPFYHEFLRRGYTVFAVVHGSQPKFTIPEIIDDLHRAVRFIRYHAKDYHIDAEHLGIIGASAGGHLALMLGTAGRPGDPKAKDPVERESSRVQAVAAFFPPTDFLNYGGPGKELNLRTMRAPFTAAFDFKELDRLKAVYVPVTDEKKVREICKAISPIAHVTPDDAPVLLLHGDEDPLVPLQQSETMLARLREARVPARLIVKKGAGHGWFTIFDDLKTCADWFDEHLAHIDRIPAEEQGEQGQ
jgi:acetyl esterase/lipase